MWLTLIFWFSARSGRGHAVRAADRNKSHSEKLSSLMYIVLRYIKRETFPRIGENNLTEWQRMVATTEIRAALCWAQPVLRLAT